MMKCTANMYSIRLTVIIGVPIILISNFFFSFEAKPSSEVEICRDNWAPFVHKISRAEGANVSKSLIFIGSDGEAHDCFGVGLNEAELEHIEALEKTFMPENVQEKNLPPGEEICIVARYTYDGRLVDYGVKLPYDRDILNSHDCIVNFKAAMKYYFGEEND